MVRPFAGRLADSLGRRPLLIFGSLLCGIAMLLMPIATSLAQILALRLLQGVAEAVFVVAGFAMLADIVPTKRMGEALSYNSLGLYLGIALGPVIAQQLLAWGSFALAWYGAAVLTAISALLAVLLPESRQQLPSEEKGPLIHRAAIPISLGFFACLAAVGGFLAFASLHAQSIGLVNASLGLFVYGCVVLLCRTVFAKVPDRLPELRLATGSLVCVAAGLGVLALAANPAGFFSGVVLIAVGVSFSTPAFLAAIFATSDASQRGSAAGTASAFMDLGLGVGPVALGIAASGYGIPAAFGLGAVIAALGASWTLYLIGRPTVIRSV